MSDTRALLEKISAFRQKLEGGCRFSITSWEEASAPANDADSLPDRVESGSQRTELLQRAIRQLNGCDAATPTLPVQLTARARRLLEEGRTLVADLRQLGQDPLMLGMASASDAAHGAKDPLQAAFHETVAMTDSALRLVQAFPDTPSQQLRLCAGLEGILTSVRERLQSLRRALETRGKIVRQVETLADLLQAVAQGKRLELPPFAQLAAEILADARTEPIRFHAAAPLTTRFTAHGPEFFAPTLFVACHSLTTAQVVAWLALRDSDWKLQAQDAVMAALLHDVGMLRVPAEVLAKAGPLDDAERRIIEAHPCVGAEMVQASMPHAAGLVHAIASHHERLDGTGYPMGLKQDQIAALPRFLAAADVYAALGAARPHRPAQDPRSALTDTLLLGEKGLLDRHYTAQLMRLSFYPTGSVVELADGTLGMVVANHVGHSELKAVSRPVLAMLTDARGQLLPTPKHIDLALIEGAGIVRTVPESEWHQRLGKRYPEWAA